MYRPFRPSRASRVASTAPAAGGNHGLALHSTRRSPVALRNPYRHLCAGADLAVTGAPARAQSPDVALHRRRVLRRRRGLLPGDPRRARREPQRKPLQHALAREAEHGHRVRRPRRRSGLERYKLRQVATDGQGNIIGRVYDYLDPVQSQVCQEAPLAPNCRQGQYYYVAVVLSGCYTDNVFGDDAYAESVGWRGPARKAPATSEFASPTRCVINASCQGSPGFNMNPVHLDLAGLGNKTDGGAETRGRRQPRLQRERH